VLSIPGKYVVLLPGDNYIGVSKKIDDFNLRKKIKSAMRQVQEEGYGVIVRTEGAAIDPEVLALDYITIKEQWKETQNKFIYMKAPQLLFNAKDFYEFIIREFIRNDIDKIFINREADLLDFKEKLSKIDKSLAKNVIYEEYNFTMQDKIEKEIQRARERKILLNSGAYIVIDHTEAFTCIDVNSGSSQSGDSSEDMILKVNLEACKEISNAIRLRNISGILLI
jgi:ribonuclease G